jgi:hypothetical protein
MAFHLIIHNNFQYSDVSEIDDACSYSTYEDALFRVKALIDKFLVTNWKRGISPEELLAIFNLFGNDPSIISDDYVEYEHFSARNYSIKRVKVICQKLESLATSVIEASEQLKNAPKFLFYTPEEFKKHGDQWKLIVERSIEAAEEGLWGEEEDGQLESIDVPEIDNSTSDAKDVPVKNLNQAKLIQAGIKLVETFTKHGIYKFEDLISIISRKGIPVNDDALKALKCAYGSYVVEHDNPELDDIKTVRAFQLPKSA